jgi:laminin alpha 1/2
VCDPDTGRCICPPLTRGAACQECSIGTWNYHPYKGCKSCGCHPKGSVSDQCDIETGSCRCIEGFEGEKCDQCSSGHYNFPHCWPCNCDASGTEPSECDSKGACSCDQSGACMCKAHVEGKKCASCIPGTFGLSQEDPEGCTRCFCFGRTDNCHQADYVWKQISNHATRKLTITRGNTRLNVSHGLLVVPEDQGDIVIGVDRLFTTPLYWSLPQLFLEDRVPSYNGYLRFTTNSNGDNQAFTTSDPLVQIQGNYRVILEHYPQTLSNSGRYEVRLHENFWVEKGTRLPATREMLMVALQGIQRILVRATDMRGATQAYLHGVTMDAALSTSPNSTTRSSTPAIGVEMCHCPSKYSATSCQDPGRGFYRWYKEHHVSTTILIDLIGNVKQCQCNGRAEKCHPETGDCLVSM